MKKNGASKTHNMFRWYLLIAVFLYWSTSWEEIKKKLEHTWDKTMTSFCIFTSTSPTCSLCFPDIFKIIAPIFVCSSFIFQVKTHKHIHFSPFEFSKSSLGHKRQIVLTRLQGAWHNHGQKKHCMVRSSTMGSWAKTQHLRQDPAQCPADLVECVNVR